MRPLHRVPPGRAGRLWLTRRLDTAQRGSDHLDRKLRILMLDQQRMRILAEGARREWRTAYADADAWLLRAAVLGGEDAIRGAASPRLVEIDVAWVSEMGTSYPATVDLVPGSDGAHDVDGNAAMKPTVEAFRVAILAGARCAAAEEAVRRLEAEVALTRRRLRAVAKRWLPWLQASLRERELGLEQGEQEDGVRTRRALAGGPTEGASS
jgi:V/A-type H+-transporting ATPase subunit D